MIVRLTREEVERIIELCDSAAWDYRQKDSKGNVNDATEASKLEKISEKLEEILENER